MLLMKRAGSCGEPGMFLMLDHSLHFFLHNLEVLPFTKKDLDLLLYEELFLTVCVVLLDRLESIPTHV